MSVIASESSDSELSNDEGYSTAEEDNNLYSPIPAPRHHHSSESQQRERSRSPVSRNRLDNDVHQNGRNSTQWNNMQWNGAQYSSNQRYGQQRDTVPQQDRDENQLQRRNGRARRSRRAGRRQRRRNRRQAERRDTWYFPDENSDEEGEDHQSRADLIAENNSWISNLQRNWTNEPEQRAVINTNNTAANSNAPDIHVSANNVVQEVAAAQSTQNEDNEDRSPSRQQQRDPQRGLAAALFSNASADLIQRVADRNQVIQDISQHASQIHLAAAIAAESFQQLIQATRLIASPAQDLWQSLSNWNNQEDANNESNSLVNQAASNTGTAVDDQAAEAADNRRDTTETVTGSSTSRRQRRRRQRQSREHYNTDWLTDGGSNHTTATLLPDTNSSNLSNREDQDSDESDPESNPFRRFDIAYQRQEERNAWRQRQRRRQNRERRRQLRAQRRRRREQRQRTRTHALRSDSSPSDNESQRNLMATRIPSTPPGVPTTTTPLQLLPTNLTIPIPPPLPQTWNANPRTSRETHGMQENNLTIENIPDLTNRRVAELREEHHAQLQRRRSSGVRPAPDGSSELLDDLQTEGLHEELTSSNQDVGEVLEMLLRSYIDPVDSPTELGVFIRLISQSGKLIISRVRKRITKQYFRRGDFHVALADFRRMNPEHSRQVVGVGFTGTVNNMYRLTVKQNSSFGKPTLEIRPMNRRVRRRKVHVCYKIRYFDGRSRRRDLRPVTSSRIPIPT